jgi:hypothetical protein
VFFVPVHNFLLGKFSVSICVESFENFGKVFLLFLTQQLTGNEGVGGLLEFLVSSEGLQVDEGTLDERVVNLRLAHLDDPWVLESFFGSWSLVNVVDQEFGNEVLSLVGNLTPAGIREVELAKLDLLHDLLIIGTVERWDTRKENVANNSA